MAALETRITSSAKQQNKPQNLTTPVRQGDFQQHDDKATPQKQPQRKAQSIAAIKDHKKLKINLPRVEIECEESTEDTEADEENDDGSEEEISEDKNTEEVTTGDEDKSYGATMRGIQREKTQNPKSQ